MKRFESVFNPERTIDLEQIFWKAWHISGQKIRQARADRFNIDYSFEEDLKMDFKLWLFEKVKEKGLWGVPDKVQIKFWVEARIKNSGNLVNKDVSKLLDFLENVCQEFGYLFREQEKDYSGTDSSQQGEVIDFPKSSSQ